MSKANPLKIVGEARYLDPLLPCIQVDGQISLEEFEGGFREQTVGRLIAGVVAAVKQPLNGLEAACATYIAQKMYAGEQVKLDKEVSAVIMKCFDHGLSEGFFPAPVHTLISWLVQPEEIKRPEYAEMMETLYQDLDEKRREAKARQKIARRVLSGHKFTTHECSYYLWLDLPEPWNSASFTIQAQRMGVAVAPAETFRVEETEEDRSVRVSLSSPANREILESGLSILASILARGPDNDSIAM